MSICIRLYANPAQISHCKSKLEQASEAFVTMSELLTLAGNEVRLKILYLLEQEKELCPCDMSDILGISIPAVSQHLRKMKEGGIVQARKEAQTIFYSLSPDHLKILRGMFKYIQQLNQQTQLT